MCLCVWLTDLFSDYRPKITKWNRYGLIRHPYFQTTDIYMNFFLENTDLLSYSVQGLEIQIPTLYITIFPWDAVKQNENVVGLNPFNSLTF